MTELGPVLLTLVLDPAVARAVSLNQDEHPGSLTLQLDSLGRIDNLEFFSFPSSDSRSINEGLDFASASYALSPDRFDISFSLAYDTNSVRARASAEIDFSVTVPTTYTLSGVFAAENLDEVANQFGQSQQRVYLEDRTAGGFPVGAVLFDGVQFSTTTASSSFVLGDAGVAAGSLTGILVPGHRYRYHYEAFVIAPNSGSISQATASESFTVSFAPEPVPTMGLWAVLFALCMLVGLRANLIAAAL